jgi:hypothetical protein
LPTSIQKSYFVLSRSARDVLDTALRKYRAGRTDLIPLGGIARLKPALQLMMDYRLVIQGYQRRRGAYQLHQAA